MTVAAGKVSAGKCDTMRSLMNRQLGPAKGFTLAEMLTVVAIAALMMAIAIPNITNMVRNASMTNAKNLVKAALSQAQSHAVKTSRYAGVRFQKAADGKTYLVLIENARSYDYWNAALGAKVKKNINDRYVALPNARPKALPNGVGAISLPDMPSGQENNYLKNYALCLPLHQTQGAGLENYQTFSIIFSPSGQLVTKPVTVEPRRSEDGVLAYTGSGILVTDAVYGNDTSGGTDPQEPSDAIFGSRFFSSPDDYASYVQLKYSSTVVVPNTYLNEKRALLSYDNYRVDYSPNVPVNADAYPANDSFLWCQAEDSATSMFLYMEDELKAVDEAGGGRYTDFFAQSSYNASNTGVNKHEGCEHLLINRYTGKLIDLQ